MRKYFALAFCIGLFISLSAQEESSPYYSIVAPTKMNVLYAGIDNPVEIMVNGVSHDKISLIVSGGSVSPAGPYKYNIKPDSNSKTVTIGIIADVNGKKKSAGSHEFRVKLIADPVAIVGGLKGGKISKSLLLAQPGVKVIIENFDFDVNYNVIGFSVATMLGGYSQEAISNSGTLSPEQKVMLEKLNSGDKVYFENIKVKGPDGTVRSLAPVIFEIE